MNENLRFCRNAAFFVCAMLASSSWLYAGEANKSCHFDGRYAVVGYERAPEVGTDFRIFKAAGKATRKDCHPQASQAYFEVPNKWAEWFKALKDPYLVLDSGTGPDGRQLIVYNLDSKTKILEAEYGEPAKLMDGKLEFWKYKGPATSENCSKLHEWQSGGLGGVIQQRVAVDLKTMHEQSTGSERCEATQ